MESKRKRDGALAASMAEDGAACKVRRLSFFKGPPLPLECKDSHVEPAKSRRASKWTAILHVPNGSPRVKERDEPRFGKSSYEPDRVPSTRRSNTNCREAHKSAAGGRSSI